MIRAGVSVEAGLAAAEKMFRPTFPPSEALKALVYFEDGDMQRLSAPDRTVLIEAARRVKILPSVTLIADLASPAAVPAQPHIVPTPPPRNAPPRRGPRMGA